ncbi:MAG: DUF1587 domain-containing protein, partial [Planctomycetaceae bacterium]|nr:DUF1587 domain-containing protein [Planctomycetaceae bacterium]
MARSSLTLLLLLASLAALLMDRAAATHAAEANTDLGASFLALHCQACHSGDEPQGDFRLSTLTDNFADRANREQWLNVLQQVKDGAMPPANKPRPTTAEVAAFITSLAQPLATAAAVDGVSPGRVVLRRLNQAEYKNTVRDLLDVHVELHDLLPPDTSTSGFDNSAEALHVSSYQMESYLEAAERVLDAAIANGPRPRLQQRRLSIKDERTVKPTGSVYRHTDDGVAIFSSWVSANIQVTLWNFRTIDRGRYRVRISGYGYQTPKPVMFHVVAGTLTAVTEQRLIDYFEVPADQPTVVEFVEQLEPRNTFRIVADNLGALPPEVQKVGAENYKGPGLVVQWVEIEGPLLESWPPESHRRLFGDLKQEPAPTADEPQRREVVSTQPLVDAERILSDFARRAFRRPVTAVEVQPFVARVATKLSQGVSFEQAMRVGLRAVLVSPHFLFLREVGPASRAGLGVDASSNTASSSTASPSNPPNTSPAVPRPARLAGPTENRPASIQPLDDFALASRLSYFLWSSMP